LGEDREAGPYPARWAETSNYKKKVVKVLRWMCQGFVHGKGGAEMEVALVSHGTLLNVFGEKALSTEDLI
jgi:hypothetical protein